MDGTAVARRRDGGAGQANEVSGLPDDQVPTSTKLSIVAVGMLSFIGILTETSLNVTFPKLQQEFGKPLSTVQLLTSGYLLMVTLMMSASAYLMKRFDARTLFRAAALFSVVGLLLCLVPGNYWVLLAGRLMQAMATGISTPLLIRLIITLVPISRRGTYMGFANMITSFAPALGPTYGGTVNNYFSWRVIFAGLLPLVVMAWVIGEFNVRLEADGAKQNGKSGSFDVLGLVLLCCTMLGITQILDQISVAGGWSMNVGIAIVVALVALALFVWRCLSAQSPLLDLHILKKPIIALRGCNYFILQFVNIGCSFLLPVFAENYLHIDSMVAGLMLLPGSLLGAVVAPLAGRLYDHHGPSLVFPLSNSSMLIGALALYLLSGNAGVVLLGCLYAFLRLGFNLGYGNTMSDASKFVESTRQTDFNPLFNVVQQYAGSLGTTFFSMALSVSTIHMPGNISQANLNGTKWAFQMVICICVVALVLTLISIKVRPSLAPAAKAAQRND